MFPNISYDLPEGGGSPAHANDSVTLLLSDGNIVTVCDTVSTALKLLVCMRQNSQWQVLASDDVSVVSINAVKALVMENTITNQKLLT